MSDNIPSILTFSEDVATAEQPKPLPPGVYIAEIVEAKVARSQKETLYLVLSLRISADQFPADYAEENPTDITLLYRKQSLEDTPRARHTLRKLSETLGVVINKEFDPTIFVGQAAKVHVKHDTYEGVTNAVADKLESAE